MPTLDQEVGGLGTVLVYGATGTQGGPVARRLLQRGVAVRALVRDRDKARSLADAGADLVVGDLRDPNAAKQASTGADAVFIVASASVPAEEYLQHTWHALGAAREADISRVVLATSGIVPDETTATVGLDAKRTTLDFVRQVTPHAVVLTTTIYLDNISALMREPIAAGVLPYPITADVPVAWQSLDDHAAYAVAALTRPGLDSRRFDLGGPEALTGPQLAERIAAHAGHPVQYQPVPPAAFQAQLEPFLGAEVAAMIAGNYAYESGPGAALLTPDTTATARELGVTPTSIDAWAAATFGS